MAGAQTGFLNVLVIDDDADVRGLVSALVLEAGHRAVAAASAEEGLAQLPFFTFEVALLDHHLPGMEGFVLGTYLRENNPHMQIALVTGGADPRLRRLARDQGIALIDKPFEPEAILAVIDRYSALEDERHAAASRRAEPAFGVALAAHHQDLSAFFGAPNVPRRLQDLLVRKVQRALERMRLGHADELDRLAAYSGLIAADVLGVSLPRDKGGETLFERYDALMRSNGQAVAFTASQETGAGGHS